MENFILRIVDEIGQLRIYELVDRLRISNETKFTEIAKKIHFLWKSDTLNLNELDNPFIWSKFFLSLSTLWFWTLTVLVSTTSLVIFYVSKSPFIYLRYFLASLYVLYLPGSMLIETLYPRQEDLKPLERLSLSIGSSLVIVVLTGFILNSLPWGIELTATTLSLAIFTEVMGVIALMRKNKYFMMDAKQ